MKIKLRFSESVRKLFECIFMFLIIFGDRGEFYVSCLNIYLFLATPNAIVKYAFNVNGFWTHFRCVCRVDSQNDVVGGVEVVYDVPGRPRM